ncbi:MAG TPA: efflux RND transporter periplasmic adaptor subunit [Candidatus Sulfopaludibacter sp.]|nr:efflux RND transporter periplasmic adaptor subunit [Candidatus Sulfopaludibacter sp.]
MLKSVLGVSSVLGALLLCSCSRTPAVQARSEATHDLPVVAVAQVKTSNLTRSMALTAEFKPYQEVEVMAKVAGYVKQINVDIGDRVKMDQVLATLEIPEMADDMKRAKANVQHSQAEVRRANDELERAKSAHDMTHLSYTRLNAVNKSQPGLVAQQEIDDAHSKDLVAEAQVSAARSAASAAEEQVAVSQAEQGRVATMMNYTRVTAPFAGVVTKRFADTGSMIQAGTASQTQAMPLVKLAENDTLRLIVPVPESAVPTVHLGQQVEVRVPTLNRSFPGKVVRFANQLALQTRTMDTEVDVANPGYVLMPGMYAEVNLTLTRRSDVLAVPVTAVDADTENGASKTGRVMVVTHNNRVEVRKIQLGLETANDIEVLSGLNEGDQVVIGGRSGLQPGEEVKPKLTAMGATPQGGDK